MINIQSKKNDIINCIKIIKCTDSIFFVADTGMWMLEFYNNYIEVFDKDEWWTEIEDIDKLMLILKYSIEALY